MKVTRQYTVLVALFAVAACGGDDNGSGGTAGARRGSGGKSGSEAGAVTDADAMVGGKSLTCGATKCRLPEASPYELCCKDMFTGECGLLMGDNLCQQMRSEVVTSCPLPEIPGIADATAGSGAGGGVSGCCTPANECGVDLGIGMGCSSNSSLCSFFPPEYASKLKLITCDGKELDAKPAGCTAPDGAAGSE